MVRGASQGISKALDYTMSSDSPRLGSALLSQFNGTTTGNDDQQVQVRCIFKRSPSFSDPPSVHFFSSKLHINGTKGCSNSTTFKLNLGQLVDETLDNDLDDDEVSPSSGNNQSSRAAEATLTDYDDVLVASDLASFREQLLDTKLYDPSLRTYFIVHGFMASWKSTWMCDLKDVILDNEHANVFVVDWSGGSKPMVPIDYPAAVSNTKWVGKALGSFIGLLTNMTNQVDASNFHLIGHSLGAHISGFAGYQLEPDSLGRITALDPAGPCFGAAGINPTVEQLEEARQTGHIDGDQMRLSQASAKLVVAIHTDVNRFGTREPVGHYDIYLNGGETQPGCAITNFAERSHDIASMKLTRILDPKLTCGHGFCYKSLAGWSLKEAQNGHQCYPMAYRCSSWEAFRSGECGLCLDGNQCLYVGLSADQLAFTSFQERSADENTLFVDDDVDDLSSLQSDSDSPPASSNLAGKLDDEINGEHWVDMLGTLQAGSIYERILSKFRHNNHFLRSSDRTPNCLYHYQLVVGARPKKTDVGEDERFFVEIPLPSLDDQTDEPRKRLVRVSHHIAPNSTNYKRIADILPKIQPQIAVIQSNLQLHTAVITFSAESNCSAPSLGGSGWSLCNPLNDLANLKLFANTGEQLGRVEWLALNYMSGIDLSSRQENSFLFANPNHAEPHRVAPDNRGKLLARLESNEHDDGSTSAAMLNSVADVYHQTMPNQVKCMIGNTECWDETRSLKRSLELVRLS